MRNFILGVLFMVFIGLVGFVFYQAGKQTSQREKVLKTTNEVEKQPSPTSSQPLVGNDRDEHGCTPSAGYIWCEVKNKCIRTWEESCSITVLTPTIDDRQNLKAIIKQALINKYGPSANELTITVSKIQGNYASGGASASDGGGMWFAARINNSWNLVWDGNGVILCSDLKNYPEFPVSFIPECYDNITQKTVKR